MKHNIKNKKLNRNSSHRKALLMNLSNALIKHEQITTTLPKAKALRPFVEKLLTMGKKADLLSRRKIISVIQDKSLSKKYRTEKKLSAKYRIHELQKRGYNYIPDIHDWYGDMYKMKWKDVKDKFLHKVGA